MGSMLGDLPSFDPHNFSQLRPSDPSNPSKMTPATYRPTHSRTLPPPDQASAGNYVEMSELELDMMSFFCKNGIALTNGLQIIVITTEAKNILIRNFYQRAEEKLRPKRAATEHLIPEHGCKQPRASTS
ncbi:hypothetical protein QUC31_008981 [Theobroma cacao]|nr:DET1- and DDB1-associated protein 1 [Theobroma cacao]